MTEVNSKSLKTINVYKLVDYCREQRKIVRAQSLKELFEISRSLFNYSKEVILTIVLEQDGTEIDDEEYFATLETNTCLMLLFGDQKWKAIESKTSLPQIIVIDDTDYCNQKLKKINKNDCTLNKPLISSIRNESSHLSFLCETDLETLSDMDPDSVADIVSDRLFLEQLKEASGRMIAEKRQAQESEAVLQILSSTKSLEKL